MRKASLPLEDLWACFQGIIPAALSTCAADGTPYITFISQVYYVDSKHVAISFQFFNKTHRNVRENPFACVVLLDRGPCTPIDFDSVLIIPNRPDSCSNACRFNSRR